MPELPDALVLCGGEGTRLKSITGNLPKSMASVAGKPFLELLFRQLRRQGFERVILAVGYQNQIIQSHFGENAAGLEIVYSREPVALGTGGAIRNAVPLLRTPCVLVMNGDSYTDVDLKPFMQEHLESKADVSLVVTPADGRVDGGTLATDSAGRVERFDEKVTREGSNYLNAGIYLISSTLLNSVQPERAISLEKELFPLWLSEGRHLHAHVFSGDCVDIGTPDRYQGAQVSLSHSEE